VVARLYYPATLSGQDAPFDPAGGPYPVIAFGHGFLQEIFRYLGTFEHLASHGFFVIAPNSETGFFPSHQALADDLNSGLAYVVERNGDAASPYFGHVAVDRLGLSGHSMGGGASILAAAGNAEIDALINMAAAETNPSAMSCPKSKRRWRC
jgi:dienelactone hydrolase